MTKEKKELGGTLGEGEASKENDQPIEAGQESIQSTNSNATSASADSQTEVDPFCEKHICSICGEEFIGFGNNPWPAIDTGEPCCDICNESVVLPARLEEYYARQKNKKP